MRGPALERRAGGGGADAGALPAVLRVRVAGRMRGEQVGGTGLERLREHRQDGARPADGGAGRGHRACGDAGKRGGTGAARAAGRLGGDARGDRRALAARARGAGASGCMRACSSRSFAAGVEALRALAQEHATPDVARLSDERRRACRCAGGYRRDEGHAGARISRRARIRGAAGGVSRSSGSRETAEEVALKAWARARAGASQRGTGAWAARRDEAWLTGRFQAPYLRDELLTHGVMVETLETATRWSNVRRLHDAVAGAIERGAARIRGRPVW